MDLENLDYVNISTFQMYHQNPIQKSFLNKQAASKLIIKTYRMQA